jgi:hypothetical protein
MPSASANTVHEVLFILAISVGPQGLVIRLQTNLISTSTLPRMDLENGHRCLHFVDGSTAHRMNTLVGHARSL